MALHRDMIAPNADYIETHVDGTSALGIEMFNTNRDSSMLVVLNQEAAIALRDELSKWISASLVADIERLLR